MNAHDADVQRLLQFSRACELRQRMRQQQVVRAKRAERAAHDEYQRVVHAIRSHAADAAVRKAQWIERIATGCSAAALLLNEQRDRLGEQMLQQRVALAKSEHQRAAQALRASKLLASRALKRNEKVDSTLLDAIQRVSKSKEDLEEAEHEEGATNSSAARGAKRW